MVTHHCEDCGCEVHSLEGCEVHRDAGVVSVRRCDVCEGCGFTAHVAEGEPVDGVAWAMARFGWTEGEALRMGYQRSTSVCAECRAQFRA